MVKSAGTALIALLLLPHAGLLHPTFASSLNPQGSERVRVYVGSYAPADSQGIHVFDLNAATGALTPAGGLAGVANPSFLAIHPGKKFLYAVCEMSAFEGKKGGAVSAISIDPGTGKLALLNQQSSEGAGPCHISVDKEGKCALVANYGGGSVTSLPIRTDGKLGAPVSSIKHEGPKAPRAHSINVDVGNRFAVAADAGVDKLMVYKLDPVTATLTPNTPPGVSTAPGTAPRHSAFHPNGKFLFVNNEASMSETAFAFDGEKGVLTEIHTVSTLPEGYKGRGLSTAETQVHPSGKFLYVSNRGHDTIAMFSIDPATGKLTPIGHESTQGKTPRNFGIDPTGTFLIAANQGSDTLVVFRIDPATGKLAPTGHSVKAPKPVCVRFIQG